MKSLLFLLFILPFSLFAQESATIMASKGSNNTYDFFLFNAPSAMQRANAQESASWGYLWEFGDGHYSREEKPSYAYAETGTYRVKVYLTPQYSTSKPKLYTEVLNFEAGRNRQTPQYETSAKSLPYVTTNHEPVREEEMLVVLHYKKPEESVGEGYIALGYNQSEFSGQDFRLLDWGTYYDEEIVEPTAKADIATNIRNFMDKKMRDYEEEKIFRFTNMKPNEERRIFLRMEVSNKVKIGEDLSFTALVLPETGDFNEKKSIFEFPMRIEASHDPNRMRVNRQKIAYNKKRPREVVYRVEFQNKGKGSADKVKIAIPLDSGLDSSSIRIIDYKPDSLACPICPEDVDMSVYNQSCLEKKTTTDSVFFIFHNIQLHGKKEDGLKGKEFTKGELVYAIKTNGLKQAKVRAKAGIIFPAQPTIWTNGVSTQYRLKRFGFKAGLNIPVHFCDAFAPDTEISPLKNFTAGFTFSDVPVRSGFGWEVEANYAQSFYTRGLVREIPSDYFNILEEDVFSEMKLGYLNVTGQIKYTFNSLFSVGAGAGPAFLLSGTADTYRAFIAEEEVFLLEESSISRFGILNKAPTSNAESETVFADGENAMGMNMFIDFTIGMPGYGVSLGGRYNYRAQPKLYDKKNVGLQFIQLYLQWRF